MNELHFLWNENPVKHEVTMVECDLCKNKWVAIRPEGTLKLECKQCGYTANYENVKVGE